MEIRLQETTIEIVNEPTYSPGSADNSRRYEVEVTLVESGYRHTSCHGVIINDDPAVVILAGGGCSTVHDHSAVLLDGLLYLAVGNYVACFEISSRQVKWSAKVDTATCFGVYYNAQWDALLSHGELEITRFTRDGRVLWSSSGADIFSEGFALKDGWVEAVDFNQKHYRFNYDTGKEMRT